jgi:hypothetical protein
LSCRQNYRRRIGGILPEFRWRNRHAVLSILLGQIAGGQQFRPGVDASGDEKDWALLTVIEQSYSGDLRAVEVFRELLKANGIRFEFRTY